MPNPRAAVKPRHGRHGLGHGSWAADNTDNTDYRRGRHLRCLSVFPGPGFQGEHSYGQRSSRVFFRVVRVVRGPVLSVLSVLSVARVVRGQASGFGRQIIALRYAGRPCSCRAIAGDCGLALAGHLEEVAADGIEPVVAGHPRIGIEGLISFKPVVAP